MDFQEDQDDHEMEEEDEEEMGIPETYDSLQSNSIRNNQQQPPPTTAATTPPPQKSRYRECLKNHAVGIGGHAVDGCGEFMPAGPENTLDALKCAACNCHRNFHRKEPATTATELIARPRNHHELFFPSPFHNFGPCYRPPTGYLHVAPQQARPLALPSTSGGGGGHSREDNYQEDIAGSSRKRFRTKFTQEQKEKMLALAENLGWRIQKHDEDAVQQFCNETGVKRHVFKVWMHNNKHTLGKKP